MNDLYIYLMRLGACTGCHQRPDRSFFWKKYQFPVCARCCGVMLSYLIAIPLYMLWGSNYIICIVSAVIMLIDWSLQFLGIRQSTNCRRFITGLFGGYGIMTIQIMLVLSILKTIKIF